MVESNVKKEVSKGKPIAIPTLPKITFPDAKNNQPTNVKKNFPVSKNIKPINAKRSFTDSKNNKPNFSKKSFPDSKGNKPSNFNKPLPDLKNNKPTNGKRPFPNSKNNKIGPAFKKAKQSNNSKNNKPVQSNQNAKKPKDDLLSRLNSDSKNKNITPQGNLKKKLRDASRLLKKKTLNAETRQNTERHVKALELEVSDVNKNKKFSVIAKKYRKVRLIESTRAARNIKGIEKKLKEARESTDNKEEILKLEEKLLNAQVDYNYTKHFPLNEKYISLFVSTSANDKLPKDVYAKKQKVREDIKNKMISGELIISKKPKPSTVQRKAEVTEETPATKIEVADDFFAGNDENSSESSESGSEGDESEDGEAEGDSDSEGDESEDDKAEEDSESEVEESSGSEGEEERSGSESEDSEEKSGSEGSESS